MFFKNVGYALPCSFFFFFLEDYRTRKVAPPDSLFYHRSMLLVSQVKLGFCDRSQLQFPSNRTSGRSAQNAVNTALLFILPFLVWTFLLVYVKEHRPSTDHPRSIWMKPNSKFGLRVFSADRYLPTLKPPGKRVFCNPLRPETGLMVLAERIKISKLLYPNFMQVLTRRTILLTCSTVAEFLSLVRAVDISEFLANASPPLPHTAARCLL